MLENVFFEDFLDGIGELHPSVREKFDTIVLKRIVRGGDDHAGLKILLSDQARDAGRGDHAGKRDGGAGGLESSSEKGGDVRPGFSSVHADEDLRSGLRALEIITQRTTRGEESRIVQGRGARNAADTVGTEEFFGHERRESLKKIVAAEGSCWWATGNSVAWRYRASVQGRCGFSAE